MTASLCDQLAKMRFKILYIVDNAAREQLGAYLVKRELELRNCEVHLASRYVISTAFNMFQPDLVVLPKLHKVPELNEIAKNAYVALLSAESFTGSAQTTILSYKGFDESNAAVDVRFCWGEFDRDVLAREKLFPSEKLIVTGHPMTDPWYAPNTRKESKKRPIIGIASTIKVLVNAFGERNFVKLVESVECNRDADGRSIYFDPPNHAEWWVAFEAAFIRLMINVADRFPQHDIHIRPHPTERASDYLELTRNRPNVKICEGGDIVDWLEGIDILLSYISTSQIDAFVRGKRVISLKGLFPDWIIAGLPARLHLDIDDMFPAPTSLDELERLIVESQAAPVDAAAKFVRNVFNFPSERRPSVRIAEALLNFLVDRPPRSAGIKKIAMGPKRRYFQFPNADDVLMLMLDAKSLIGSSQSGVSHSYCRHRWQRNLLILSRAEKLDRFD